LILNLVTAIVLGGVAGWYGPLIGAVIITLLPEALRDFGTWRDAVMGLLMIASVAFLPRGLSDWNGLVSLWNALTRRGHTADALSIARDK
jgi:branched-chain amino acid transport system permease protein